MEERLKARVFISCGQQKNSEEERIANKIKEELIDLGYEAYIAIKEQITRGFKENIFQRLEKSEYFIFIDFRREKIEEKKNEYRGSLFSNQELALATYLDKPIIAFQEEGVKERDGILSVIQVNPIKFSSRSDLVDQVISMVRDKQEKKEWENNWREELSLDRDKDDIGKANYDFDPNKPAIFYHVRVKNNHCNKIAWRCLSYIEKIKYLDTGEVKILDLVENKWRGVINASVQIPPNQYRKFDGFHIFVNDNREAYLGFNRSITDYTGYDLEYRLKVPGRYEIFYIVYAENFFPARATFRLNLAKEIDDIDFFNLVPNQSYTD